MVSIEGPFKNDKQQKNYIPLLLCSAVSQGWNIPERLKAFDQFKNQRR